LNSKISTQVYYSLIALWAIAEAFVGGVIHDAKLPVSGLIIGSCAVACLCLIGNYYNTKFSIIRATIIVCIFKFILSPQSPPTAYFAVMFQGLLAQLFFYNNKWFLLKCVLFSVLCLVESACQRIIILTILNGQNFWLAINIFIQKITHHAAVTNYSYVLIIFYIILHVLAGLAIGFYVGLLPPKITAFVPMKLKVDLETKKVLPINSKEKKKNKYGKLLWFSFFLVLLLAIQHYFIAEKSLENIIIKIFIRVLFLMLIWMVLLKPLAESILRKWLQNQQSKYAIVVAEINNLLPIIMGFIKQSWQESGNKKYLKRIDYFCISLMSKIINENKWS